MATTTLLNLLTLALQDLKVLGAGAVPTPDDAELGRLTINDWIDGLGTEKLSMFSITRTTWTLTSAATITIGVGAVINVARPVGPQDIHAIGYINSASTPPFEFLVDLLTNAAYDALPSKTYSNLYPSAFYYDSTFGTTGFGTLVPWPLPSAGGLQGVIYTQAPLTEFAAITDLVFLPPGYRRYFRTHAALELADAFDVVPSQRLMQAAAESAANIKRANMRPVEMSCGEAGLLFGHAAKSNIYTDQ